MTNELKTPFFETMPTAAQQAAQALINLQGKAIPATIDDIDDTHTIAKVKLELDTEDIYTLPIIQCPIMGPEYVRWPLKKGDKGVVIPADFYLGGMSGLGGGKATLDQLPNLSCLMFYPLGNTDLDGTDDPNKTVFYGPDGVIARTQDKNSSADINKQKVQLSFGDPEGNQWIVRIDDTGIFLGLESGFGLKIDPTGIHWIGHGSSTMSFTDNRITIMAPQVDIGTDTTIDGREFLPHQHKDTQPGTGNSGPVN